MIYEAQVVFKGRYSTNMKYTYLTDNFELKKGDWVIVDSANGLSLAVFSNYTKNSTKVYAWILDMVNIKELRENLAEIKEIYSDEKDHN